MSLFATIIQSDYFAVSSKPPQVVRIRAELPAPDYRANNEHTLSMYSTMHTAGPLFVRDIDLIAVLLTNKNLDCTVFFSAVTKEKSCGVYFIGCIELATGSWRWCIPIFSGRDIAYNSSLRSINMHPSNTNANTVIVYHLGNKRDDPTRMNGIDECNICAEEFDVLTGTSITRTFKPRVPVISAFELVSDHTSGVVSKFVGNEDWERELLSYF